MTTRRTREQWAALIGAFEQSSQSVAAFCVAKRIAVTTFRWWRWQLRETAPSRRRPRSRVQLVPVSVRHEVVREDVDVPRAIAIGVSGIELRVEVGTDVGYVTALVASLRAQC